MNPGVIEQVIRAADLGFRRDITDLEYEGETGGSTALVRVWKAVEPP